MNCRQRILAGRRGPQCSARRCPKFSTRSIDGSPNGETAIPVVLILLANLGADGPAAAPWLRLGPREAFEFRLAASVATDSATTIKLLIPAPQQDAMTCVLSNPRLSGLRPDSWTSPDGVNRWWVFRREITADRDLAFQYEAVAVTRSIQLLPNELPASAANAWIPMAQGEKLWLTATAHTGRNWNELKDLVAATIGGESRPIERARQLFRAVLTRLEYDKQVDFAGAQAAWQARRGQCCDYVAAFVALCRASGIPARAVAGHYFHEGRWQLHVWAEFGLQGCGWIPCDPSLADANPAHADRFFGGTDGRRVAVTRDFDLDIDLRPPVDASLVQQYLVSYKVRRGTAAPRIDFHVSGRRLDATEPATAKGGQP